MFSNIVFAVSGVINIAVRLSVALNCPGALARGFKGGSAGNVWQP